jgi:hypothetical protein
MIAEAAFRRRCGARADLIEDLRTAANAQPRDLASRIRQLRKV